MKLIWSFLLLSLSVSVPMSSFAEQQQCPDRVERRGSIQVQQIASSNNANCFVSVHNFKEGGLIYRDYLFASDGNFMVFNSFGKGPESEFTGAREFFFFPRPATQPSFNWNDETRRLEVTDVSGSKFFFDYEDAQITGIDKATVKVAHEVINTNKGGVDISKFKGLMLDAGFTLGRAPTQSAAGSSTFTDEAGLTCKVKNGDLFKYSADGDVAFRYSDKGLMAFLKTKCPKLKFPAL
ncbi:hypothetical protein [Bdellovibrio svalbardensis]|uniref:Lipoprotein n=1 Tax=Bdellovibrio svalbardensis TaxID=2972972 RepID=A0ABT6DIA3_9BACT|nr:hypothetical protein [Bdellovibrio svalbardensis]MDG0816569.1 hypothetical protein [Bdellovibrio svalbardensis]